MLLPARLHRIIKCENKGAKPDYRITLALAIISIASLQNIASAASTLPESTARTMIYNAIQAEVPTFTNGRISEYYLIQFGILYNRNNYENRLLWNASKSEARIKGTYVAQVVKGYFGKTIKNHAVEGYSYENGYYTLMIGDPQQISPENITILSVKGMLGSASVKYQVDYQDGDKPYEGAAVFRLIGKKQWVLYSFERKE